MWKVHVSACLYGCVTKPQWQSIVTYMFEMMAHSSVWPIADRLVALMVSAGLSLTSGAGWDKGANQTLLVPPGGEPRSVLMKTVKQGRKKSA